MGVGELGGRLANRVVGTPCQAPYSASAERTLFHNTEVLVELAIVEAGTNGQKQGYPDPRAEPKCQPLWSGSARRSNSLILQGGVGETPSKGPT